MADMFIRSETVSGMADSIRKITNTEGKVNLGKFAKGEYEETFYEGKYTVSGTPTEETQVLLYPLTANENGTYTPTKGYDGFNKVSVAVPSGESLPEFDGDHQVLGTPTGGGGESAEFNIAYGATAPTDTSKLWIKTSEPEAVNITSDIVVGSEEMGDNVGKLPLPASNIASAVVGTRVYLFGGVNDTSINSELNSIVVFNTETNTIATLGTSLPRFLHSIASAAVGTKVYLFGGASGDNSFNTIYVFDTETYTITTLSTKLPTAAYGVASAVVGKKVYLFGGTNDDNPYNTICVFDTEYNTITTLSTKLPAAAYGVASAVVGKKVYLFGGTNDDNSFNTIYVFDTETYTITTLSTKLTKELTHMASAVVGKKVYLFGGYIRSKTATTYIREINVFDTETNTIATLGTSLPSFLRSIASAAVGTKVYLFGGFDGTNTNHYHNTIHVFNVQMALATDTMLIETSIAKNLFNLLPNVEIGVNSVYLGNSEGIAEKVPAALYKDGEWREI